MPIDSMAPGLTAVAPVPARELCAVVSRSALLAALAVVLAAGEAGASIPPPDDRPPRWEGPVRVCAEAFAVELAPGDAATAGWPSVGRIPYSVQAAAGRVDIVELWASGVPETGARSQDRGNGTLYRLPAPSGFAASTGDSATEYLFRPSDPKGLPVVVIFYGPEWGEGRSDAMLDRIDFGRRAREGCGTPVKG